jgi:ATP/maltotriose-dependent transcriptional regulator MalT
VIRELTALVDQSLVQRVEGAGEPRFSMLETVRAFGLQQLMQRGEDAATRDRHAAYFIVFAEQGYPNRPEPFTRIDARLQGIEHERANLRAALTHLAAAGNAEGVLRLAAALAIFWQLRGHFREGRQWLEWALEHTAEASSGPRGRALEGLALIVFSQGDPEQALPLAHESLAIAEQIGDRYLAALSIHMLALIAEVRQRWDQAGPLFEQSLGMWRQLGAQAEEAMVMQLLSRVAYGRGDREESATRAEEALVLFRSIGHDSGAAHALCRLAVLARDRGDDREAALTFHEALQLWSSIGDRWYIVIALAGLAELASVYGEATSAATLLGRIDTQMEEVGALIPYSAGITHARAAAAASAVLGAGRFAALHAAGKQMSLEEAIAIAAAIVVPTETTERVLTPREHDVLRLMAHARTDREIAEALFLSRRTVNAHVARIFDKLEVHTRREAVERGHELGLLSGNDAAFGYT